MNLAWGYWDPPRNAFTIPFFDHPVAWYGILFVAGFILAYFIINPIFVRFLTNTCHISDPKQTAYFLCDRLCWFIIAGTIIGARLAEVFFYDWPYFRENPLNIIKIWRGGLASHGGVLGVMLALFLFVKYIHRQIPQLKFLTLLDIVAVPSALVACFIRLGNFMNQEIVGIPTNSSWGILFAQPAGSLAAVPRHPVQLYEAIAYLISFFVLWWLWKYRRLDEKPGALVGCLLIFIFSSRFILEFWKAEIDSVLGSTYLHIGQLLSIPFILLGLYLFFRAKKLVQKGSAIR